jgi:hypothetical protein
MIIFACVQISTLVCHSRLTGIFLKIAVRQEAKGRKDSGQAGMTTIGGASSVTMKVEGSLS